MQPVQQGLKILGTEGLFSFLRAVCRFVYWNTGVRTAYLRVQHRVTGSRTDIKIGNVSATLSTDTYAEFERFYDLKGERKIIEDVVHQISENDVFYDIGANVGLDSCLIGSATENSEIYPFEPHPTNVESLKRNLQLNNVDCQIFQLALSDEEGEFELSSEGSEAGLGEHSLDTSGSESTVPVTVRQLDKLRKEQNIPIPTVVKIDVEGAEMNVLRGFKQSISNCRVVYCEIHPQSLPNFDSTSEQVHDYFEQYDFVLEKEFKFSEHSSGYMAKFKNKNI